MLKVYFHKDVGKTVRKAVEDFVEYVPAVVDIQHTLPLIVYGRKELEVPSSAFFEVLSSPLLGEVASIHLDGNLSRVAKYLSPPRTIPWVLGDILLSLSHELRHYEQWRDGKKVTERGVERCHTTRIYDGVIYAQAH